MVTEKAFNALYVPGTILTGIKIILIPHIRELILAEVKELAQGYTVIRWDKYLNTKLSHTRSDAHRTI